MIDVSQHYCESFRQFKQMDLSPANQFIDILTTGKIYSHRKNEKYIWFSVYLGSYINI